MTSSSKQKINRYYGYLENMQLQSANYVDHEKKNLH